MNSHLPFLFSLAAALWGLGSGCIVEQAPPPRGGGATEVQLTELPPGLDGSWPTPTRAPSPSPTAGGDTPSAPNGTPSLDPTPSSEGSPSPTLTPTPNPTPSPTASPTPTPDPDGDGVSIAEGDCRPDDGAIYPGAPDAPFDGVDSNCNGVQDRAVTVTGVRLGEGGLATQARSTHPAGLTRGSNDDLYISDDVLCRIRRIRGGQIQTVVGNGRCGVGEEGGAALSSPIRPGALTFDTLNDRLYFAEPSAHRIRYLDLTSGTLHTFIGTGERGDPEEGVALGEVDLCAPAHLVMTYYYGHHLHFTSGGPGQGGCRAGVWRLSVDDSPETALRQIAGGARCRPLAEGPTRGAELCPLGLGVSLQTVEILYIVDEGEGGGGALFEVYHVGATEPRATLIAGGGGEACGPPAAELDALGASLCAPASPAVSIRQTVYLPQANGTVLKLPSDGLALEHVAGTGSGGAPSLGGGDALSVTLGPLGPAVLDSAAEILFTLDPEVGQVRGVDLEASRLSHVAGRLPVGYVEGSVDVALFNGPAGLAIEAGGDEALYVADRANGVIRRILGGQTTRVAGVVGGGGALGDGGSALLATLEDPQDVEVAPDGTLYILTRGRIRRVRGGSISTVAGTGEEGYNGDLLPGYEATLGAPTDIALSADGRALYIADTENHRVRRLRLDQEPPVIETVLGNGQQGRLFDGSDPLTTTMGRPLAVAIHGADLYVAQDTFQTLARVRSGAVEILAAQPGIYEGVIPFEVVPYALFVDPSGALFVGAEDDRLYRLAGGDAVPILGEAGQSQYDRDQGALPGGFIDVTLGTGLVMNSRGVLYVSDEGQGVIRALTF